MDDRRRTPDSRLRTSWFSALLLALILLYSVPFVLPMLGAYLSGDDVSNLHYYVFRPWQDALLANLHFWVDYKRPVGGLVYVILYDLFGVNPLAYYLTGLILTSLNLVLAFTLLLRITKQRFLAATAVALAAIHPAYVTVWYNFGAVYETLALGLMCASFHFYLNYLEGGRKKAYILSFLSFGMALGAKEIAALLPAILLLYQLLYCSPKRRVLAASAVRLSPFFLISLIDAVGKIWGPTTRFTTNPLYRYHLDATIPHNLAQYLEQLAGGWFELSALGASIGLAMAALLALMLRNRHMIFGLAWFLLVLAPVLPLPRVWGLFLYIPALGLALYLAALLLQGVRLVSTERFRDRRGLQLGAFGVLLVLLATWHWDAFDRGRRSFLYRGKLWRGFATALFERHPDLPPDAVLVIENSPIPRYHQVFLLRLAYGSSRLQVYPHWNDYLRRNSSDSKSSYHLLYRNGKFETNLPPDSSNPAFLEVAFAGMKEQAVLDDEPVQEASFPVTERDKTSSRLLFENSSESTTILEIRGSRWSESKGGRETITLPPGRLLWPANDATGLPGGGPADLGWLGLRSDSPVSAHLLFLGPWGAAEVPLAGLAARQTHLVFPYFQARPGWDTRLVLFNPGLETAQGTLRLGGTDGSEAEMPLLAGASPTEIMFRLAPLEVRSWPASWEGASRTGWLEVNADEALTGFVKTEGAGRGSVLFPAARFASQFQFELRPESAADLFLYILNSSEESAQVELELDRGRNYTLIVRKATLGPRERLEARLPRWFPVHPRTPARSLVVRASRPVAVAAFSQTITRNLTLVPQIVADPEPTTTP